MGPSGNQTNSIPLILAVIAPPDQNTQGHEPYAPENIADKVGGISARDAQRDKKTEHYENCRDDPKP